MIRRNTLKYLWVKDYDFWNLFSMVLGEIMKCRDIKQMQQNLTITNCTFNKFLCRPEIFQNKKLG